MRSKLVAVFLLSTLLAGGAGAAVIMEKRSRQMPFVEVFECNGIYSFIFRGPTGTSREPILVPPREYWTAREAGLYSFVLRYHSGNVRSRLVTPEVFARYQVGQDFYDREAGTEQYQSDDSKATQTVVRERQTTAQVRHRSQKRKIHRAVAKPRKQYRTKRIAKR